MSFNQQKRQGRQNFLSINIKSNFLKMKILNVLKNIEIKS